MGKAPKIQVPEENVKTKMHLGTFSAPPPLCLGDLYKDKGKIEKPASTIGKQFSGGILTHQKSRVFPGTLEPPKMLWSESKDKYIDKTMYRDSVPADKKKNGFMSSDFPRRDEFSNTIRTSQLREILKKEKRSSKEAQESIDARKMAHQTAHQILDDTPGLKDLSLPAPPLFDVVYRIPEASLKLGRDDRQAGLYYKKQRQNVLAGKVEEKKSRIQGEAAWVNVSLNGRPVNLLVATSGQVLAQKVADHGKTAGGEV